MPSLSLSAEVMLAAADLATDYQLSIWDSVVLFAAAESGCRFATSKHELLAALLDAEPES